MVGGGGFGVAVTVAPVSVLLAGDEPPVPVVRRRSRLTEVLHPAGVVDARLVGELAAIADVRAQLATITRSSRTAAVGLAERALVWVRELPAIWHALADGLIDEPRARAIAAALGGQSTDAGGVVDPAVVAEVEAQAIGWAVAGETPVRLRERTAAALIAVDEAAADRRRKRAERHADVTVRPAADGMAQLVADLPGPVTAACRKAVDGYARLARKTGDERPIGQLRSLVLAELVLRPWDTSREPVTAHLTVLAPLPALDARRPAGPGRGAGAGGGEGGAGLSVPTDADAASVDGAPGSCGSCWSGWTRCARAGRGPRPAAPWSSRSPIRAAGRCGRPSPGRSCSGWCAAAARRIREGCAAARCWTGHRRRTGTPRHPPSGGSAALGTAGAGIRAVGGRPGGPTPTTWCPTPPAGGPTARTCAACAAGITG
ncbi:hypothetical protein [Modestobacter marinus]|uniref:hypothetical protein n=1 Tax=Modestobacter marinus TaxID=477641 RepID=UPI001C96B96C|nr:hypothetical protein [Modestobacter marinus]